jgi:hypothetical protein
MVHRRGSGGPTVAVGPGTLYVSLALAHPSALTACDARRLVNRYVRPLLRALTKSGAQAHYFGRDWMSVMHRPAAWIGFAHDAGSGRALVEAFIAVSTPFAFGTRPRASFLGKEPGTLEGIMGRTFDLDAVASAVVDAYAGAYSRDVVEVLRGEAPSDDDDPRADPSWTATLEEAIGEIGAGPDRTGSMRVGGDLLVSRDALAALNASLSVGDIGSLVDRVFTAPGVALDGVQSLTSVRDVVLRARALLAQ